VPRFVCARLVLDHELLAELFRQPLADQARQDVGGAARRIADQEPHRPRRIFQRRRGARKREGGDAGTDQAQRGAA
jgi:hypothetical protein